MNETSRTLTFVCIAAVSLGAAYAFAPRMPKPPNEFANVGKLFYEDFDSVSVKSLTVVSYDEATATSKTFEVKFKDGLWTIPSHHEYPADAKDRLAKTAASALGIKREEFKSNNPEDYASLGVIDPEESDTQKLKGRGQRITLRGDDEKILLDYIIGKKLKNRSDYYYVRRPDEKSVYVAKLTIDLSTKFSDYIESDLLKIEPDQLADVLINKYAIDREQGRIVGEEISHIHRDKPADPWKLDGLNEETEEVNADTTKSLVSALDDLKIVGVRPKPKGLSRDLKLEGQIKLDQLTLMDLARRGFFFTEDRELKANDGELVAATSGGVVYMLRFGEIFSGTGKEIEAGLGAGVEEDGKAEAGKEGAKADEDKKEEGKSDEKPADKKSDLVQSRYLFVTAQFDPRYLGPEPVKPEKPEEAAKAQDENKAESEKKESEENKDAADKKEEDKKPDETKPDSTAEKPAEKTDAEKAAEEEAKKKYDEALQKYETELKDYEQKIKTGNEKVTELTRRFADWYYVISADSFNKLSLNRKDLVKEKAKPETEKPEGAAEGSKTPGAKPEGDVQSEPKAESKEGAEGEQEPAKPEPPAKSQPKK